MAHRHNHHDAGGLDERRLKVSLVLTLAFVAVEIIFGIRGRSLALLSDAGHNFADSFALLLSWYAIHIARRPATPAKSYGFHRVGILTALFNALTLLAIAGIIIAEAARLFAHPERVQSGIMIVVASAALFLNASIAAWLHGSSHRSLNIRSAFVHMLGDAISSAGVVVAGIAIAITGWVYADPIVALLIALFIVWSSLDIVREAVNVLLEGTPRGLDTAELVGSMRSVDGVEDVHDLHVWTIGDGVRALSCHVRIAESQVHRAADVLRDVKGILATQYSVRHTTIETECGGCHDIDLCCQLEAPDAIHAGRRVSAEARKEEA